MKFWAVDLTASNHPNLLTPNGRNLYDEIASCKWLVWHGKASQAVARLKRIHDAIDDVYDTQYSTSVWNLRRTWWYLRSNDRYLVNYGRRRYRGLPISSAIAESAANEVVSWRMAKNLFTIF